MAVLYSLAAITPDTEFGLSFYDYFTEEERFALWRVASLREYLPKMNSAPSRGLSIGVSLPESATIFGDRDRLMQLFNNLLENSLRYTDSGGSLHITARRSGRMLVIDFADSAPGVSDEQLARLCERFYRAEGSRNRASGGSGLGLAICLNIVAAHGGTLRADHSPFGGVSIKVELPLEHDLPRDV